MDTTNPRIRLVKENIKSYQDFPKPGILFRDIFGVTANPDAALALQELVSEHCSSLRGKVDVVVGLESRGFLFGPQIALDLRVPFVPIRKPGKLPGQMKQITYDLEYGQDAFEIQVSPLLNNSNVLVVDDLLATGGTLNAACQLVNSVGGKVLECFVIMELEELRGRDKIKYPVHSIVKF